MSSGSLSISENGTYDVTNYAEAVVDVPVQVIQGDYHDDLTSINQSILICGAVLLVLYFFYCIYRMIIKSTGGKYKTNKTAPQIRMDWLIEVKSSW